MKMLLYKAWVETRMRFFAGLIAVTMVCTFYLQQHAWLVTMWSHELSDPKGYHFAWMPLGIEHFSWYLWHYLYNNYLQQVWSLFALLFAFGGLVRERSNGTVLFSLGLPISRRRWLISRLAMALIEAVAVASFALIVVVIGSKVIHQDYSLSQLILHTILMIAAGVILIALGNLCYSLVPGNYTSLLVTLVVLGVPYLLLQDYMQIQRDSHTTTWLQYFDVGHAMAGPWQITWNSFPWIAVAVAWGLTTLLFLLTASHGDRIDY